MKAKYTGKVKWCYVSETGYVNTETPKERDERMLRRGCRKGSWKVRRMGKRLGREKGWNGC